MGAEFLEEERAAEATRKPTDVNLNQPRFR